MLMQLIIKAPNQKISDYALEAQPDWSVSKLKELLSESYPSHPKMEEQKLIHAGRLLHNHLLLKDILRHEGPLHVLHLVCSGQGANQTTTSTRVTPSDVGPIQPPSQPTDVPLTGLHYRGSRQHPDSSTSQFQVPPGAPINPEVMAQQMAAMQQFYVHYMTQFMQHAQAAGGMAADLGMSVEPQSPSATPVANNAPEVRAPVDPPRAANQNIRMNAQGGPLFEDEDEVNRDWLDWFYIFSRAFVLFSIVYFYSSMGRFMVVMGISILIYMYQGGWFGRRQDNVRRRNHPEEQQRIEAPPAEPEENRVQEVEAAMDSTSIQDDPPNTPQQQMAPPVHPSMFQTVWVFVYSFFTSLVPEQPPPININ